MTVQAQEIERGIELDGGPQARQRERLCVATHKVRPLSALIRFVVDPDGEAVPDIRRKLPGRGVWVTATHEALDAAIKRKAFARAFKRDVRVPADLAARTERLLEQAVLDALAIVGKAGLVAAGFAKTEAALQNEQVAALLHAAEASPDGIRKLDAVRRRGSPENPPVVIGFLTSAQLDLALGRPNVVHAAVLAGPASDTFLSRSWRLEGFRTGRAGNRGNSAGMASAEPAVDMDAYD